MYYCKLVLYYIQLKSQTFDIVHVQQNLGNFCTKTALPGSKMSQIFHWMKIPLICLVQNIVKQVRKNYWLFYWNCSNTTVINTTVVKQIVSTCVATILHWKLSTMLHVLLSVLATCRATHLHVASCRKTLRQVEVTCTFCNIFPQLATRYLLHKRCKSR